MSYAVDFVNVSTVGLESSPVAAALAGLRANEARYYKTKYDHVIRGSYFVIKGDYLTPASQSRRRG